MSNDEDGCRREIAMSVAKAARNNEVERTKRAPRVKSYDRAKDKKDLAGVDEEPTRDKYRALPRLKEKTQIPDARVKDPSAPEKERYR